MSLPKIRAALDRARRRHIRASVSAPPLRMTPDYRASYEAFTRAAGRYAVALAEAGADPRAVESIHDHGAGALIGLSGASKARRHAAQQVLTSYKRAA